MQAGKRGLVSRERFRMSETAPFFERSYECSECGRRCKVGVIDRSTTTTSSEWVPNSKIAVCIYVWPKKENPAVLSNREKRLRRPGRPTVFYCVFSSSKKGHPGRGLWRNRARRPKFSTCGNVCSRTVLQHATSGTALPYTRRHVVRRENRDFAIPCGFNRLPGGFKWIQGRI